MGVPPETITIDIEELADDAADTPLALVAVTVNVYVPPAIPVTVIGDVSDDAEYPPVLLVAVYVVTVELPDAPGVNATVTEPPPISVTAPIVGACGFVETVTEFDTDVAIESPLSFTAFM